MMLASSRARFGTLSVNSICGFLSILGFMALLAPAEAGEFELRPVLHTETKAVFGRVETRDVVPARSRIGGTLVKLNVTEGDAVQLGQTLGKVIDDKLALQMKASDARIRALNAERANAQGEFERAAKLLQTGFGTRQRSDQLKTQLDVLKGQIAAAEADKSVILQQSVEGDVLAPVSGRVLKVPVSAGAVVMAGEQVALVAGSGFFLRLALPERHANALKLGSTVEITEESGQSTKGRLAKIFPQIENGRVIADVEIAALGTFFVGARVLAQVPVGERSVLAVPRASIKTVSGIDFVTLATPEGSREVAVILGRDVPIEGAAGVEVLSGLKVGDKVVTP